MAKPHPHVMMVPFPMQGHVIPMLELAQLFAKQHHIRITFVNTAIIHDLLLTASEDDGIRFVSVSDGLETAERCIPGKMTEAVYRNLPRKVEELVREINEEEDDEVGKISCVVYDQCIGGIQKVAKKMRIRTAAFFPAAAALLVLGFNITKLIEDGIIDDDGTPLSSSTTVQFAPKMPTMIPSDFPWNRLKILTMQKLSFHITRENNQPTEDADRLICNSIHDLEPGVFAATPHILPIGPLLGNSAYHFFKHDSDNSLEWLDKQQPCSVIYVAFGSFTRLSVDQFQELALGLERTNRPFLWVVRPEGRAQNRDFFPEGFLDRVSSRGRIVGWAPQQRVLSHPSIACFVSHCGWNSTVESVSNGVPILCWPSMVDQFINQGYICDIWKVGKRFEKDVSGDIVTCGEIKEKIDRLVGDGVFRERALHLKEVIQGSAREGGSSYKNLRDFVSWLEE